MYFFLKEPKSDKTTLINLTYYIDEVQGNFKYSTKEKIHPSDWDKDERMPIKKRGRSDLAALSSSLNRYVDFMNYLLNQLKILNQPLDKAYLKSQFDIKFNRVKEEDERVLYFSDYIPIFLKKAPSIINVKTQRKLSKRTLQAYDKVYEYFCDFEKYKKKKYKFSELNLKLHADLSDYFSSQKKLAVNTIGGYIKNVKIFARNAAEDGYKVNPKILSKDFYVAEEESQTIYLTENEIKKILYVDLSDNIRWQKVRDWSIIGFWTGLRVGDWSQFEGFENGYITITPAKTQYTSKKKVVIPMHWMIKEVIEKRGIPERISEVEFNRLIKKISKKAGIDQVVYGSRRNPKTNLLEKGHFEKCLLVTAHTCRRSFATNNYLMGVDTYTIMQITGHTTEKNFLKYIKVSPKEHAQRMADAWNKIYKK